MIIRPATIEDRESIAKLHRSAFPEDEWQKVTNLAAQLLQEATPAGFSLVVDDEQNHVIGHVAFSPVTAPSMPDLRAAILAPLAIAPDTQRQGLGSALVNHGLDILTEEENHIVFVYGDPEYYGRFGFTAESAENFLPPYELQFPTGWLAMALTAEAPPTAPVPISCVPALQDPTLW